MKFLYEYRTSDNVRHTDIVIASSREAAFQLLKSRGIKPSKVVEASGFFNKLWGKGKRWIAITVLGVMAMCLLIVVIKLRSEISTTQVRDVSEKGFDGVWEDRAQIYGDPVVLSSMFSDGFESVFTSPGERFLARFAIPGQVVKLSSREIKDGVRALESMSMEMVVMSESDFIEVVKLKKIINGMKIELQNYLRAGGTVALYVKRLQSRQNEEYRTYQRVKTELQREKNLEIWKTRNLELRVLGLPMVELPVEENTRNRY